MKYTWNLFQDKTLSIYHLVSQAICVLPTFVPNIGRSVLTKSKLPSNQVYECINLWSYLHSSIASTIGLSVRTAPDFINSPMMLECFSLTASSKGVTPLRSFTCTDAPWWRRYCTVSTWPSRQATCNAVRPSWLCEEMLPPFVNIKITCIFLNKEDLKVVSKIIGFLKLSKLLSFSRAK